MATKLFTVLSNIFGSSVWNLLHANLVVYRIMRLILQLRKICVPLAWSGEYRQTVSQHGRICRQIISTLLFYWLLQSTCRFQPPQSWGFEITHNDTTQSVGLLRTSDQPVAETSSWQTHNTHNRQKSMPTAGFEPAISGGERLQTHALDSSATGIG